MYSGEGDAESEEVSDEELAFAELACRRHHAPQLVLPHLFHRPLPGYMLPGIGQRGEGQIHAAALRHSIPLPRMWCSTLHGTMF